MYTYYKMLNEAVERNARERDKARNGNKNTPSSNSSNREEWSRD